MDSDRKKKGPSSITIKRAASGGFIATHHYDNFGSGDSYQPPQDHVITDHKGLSKHIGKHFGAPGGSQISTMDKDHASNTGAQTAQSHKSKVRPAHPGPRSHGAGVD